MTRQREWRLIYIRFFVLNIPTYTIHKCICIHRRSIYIYMHGCFGFKEKGRFLYVQGTDSNAAIWGSRSRFCSSLSRQFLSLFISFSTYRLLAEYFETLFSQCAPPMLINHHFKDYWVVW